MEIVNLFYELARTITRLAAMIYGRTTRSGAGNEIFPLLWLDDPLLYSSRSPAVGAWTLNVDILGIPETEAEIASVQGEAFLTGLSLIERIRELKGVFAIESYSAVSLSDYYDFKAAGWRFTLIITRATPINLCVEYYDSDKQNHTSKPLPDFATDNPDGCAVFNPSLLPNFKL